MGSDQPMGRVKVCPYDGLQHVVDANECSKCGHVFGHRDVRLVEIPIGGVIVNADPAIRPAPLPDSLPPNVTKALLRPAVSPGVIWGLSLLLVLVLAVALAFRIDTRQQPDASEATSTQLEPTQDAGPQSFKLPNGKLVQPWD